MISAEEGEEELRRIDDEAYIKWLQVKAEEIAATLKKLDPHRINQIIKSYEQYLEYPASMHVPLEEEEEETIKQLVGSDRLKNIILLKTKVFIFAPSILAPSKSSLDFGTAMYRRFSLHGFWFSIIALNEAYLKSATQPMLRYMLEHELAQGEIYAELAVHNIKNLGLDMKGVIHEDARIKAIQRSGISDVEVEQEKQLIIDLSTHHPLVPVHFASASLFKYLEENWENVKQFGLASQNEAEKELERSTEKLAEWADFAINSFTIFLKELKREITMTGAEYGVEIV
jgi:hypothetical protein